MKAVNKLTESPIAIEMAQRLAEKQKVDSPDTVMQKVRRFDRITVGAMIVAILSAAFVIAGLAPDANTRMLSVIISFGGLGVFISAMLGKNILLREAYIGEFIERLALKEQVIEEGLGDTAEERKEPFVYVGLVPSAEAAINAVEEELELSEKFDRPEKSRLHKELQEVLQSVRDKRRDKSLKRNPAGVTIESAAQYSNKVENVRSDLAIKLQAIQAGLDVPIGAEIVKVTSGQVGDEKIVGTVSGEPVVFYFATLGTSDEDNGAVQRDVLEESSALDVAAFMSRNPD